MRNIDSERPPLIEYRNISISYPPKPLFKDFNLKINRGEKIVIRGVSGSGKSSLLKALLGFVVPISGIIYFENNPITDQNIWVLRQKISYVDQNFDIGSGPVMSIIRNIFSLKANKQLVLNLHEIEELLTVFSLPHSILSQDYERLSGGEKQRIQIINAILLKREIFLLDEVTSAIDQHLKQVVMQYFVNSNHTIIVVAHDDIWMEGKTARCIDLKEGI